MTTFIICLILLLIVLFSVKSYLKKLKRGCCGSGDAPQKIKPADGNLAHYPCHQVVAIEGMTCSHCVQRIENAFNGQPGVLAKVNLGKGCADVYSQTPLMEDDLRRTVAKAGYIPKEIQSVSV